VKILPWSAKEALQFVIDEADVVDALGQNVVATVRWAIKMTHPDTDISAAVLLVRFQARYLYRRGERLVDASRRVGCDVFSVLGLDKRD
jgi:hypothetical protein